ncbi:SDR family NAD(P)-dependent oxidoreductase [Paenibacillus rhizoplanae]
MVCILSNLGGLLCQSKTQALVVVTGTSSGIGRATAEQLAAEGFHVLAGGSPSGRRRQNQTRKISSR